MKSNRFRIAAVAFGVTALLSASPAKGSPGEGSDGSGGRIALNGTQLTGMRAAQSNSADDGRIAVNGTRLTGIRGASK
jgi:hypothetical protein